MSVNRDPKVGDRFTWGAWGDRGARVVTGVEGNHLRYRLEGCLVGHAALIKRWRAHATLIDPEPDVPAVGTELDAGGDNCEIAANRLAQELADAEADQ